MKKTIVLIAALWCGFSAGAQGIEFFKGSYAEAMQKARAEDKLIFIDVYTTWCGPCKAMAEEVFTQQQAGDLYNAKFIPFKADAEKAGDGLQIAKKFDVSAYPTLLFVNGDGELVYRFLGGRDIDGLLKEGDNALKAAEAYPRLKEYDAKYKAGERGAAFLDQYATLKEASGLDCSDILSDYFAGLDDEALFAPANAKRIENMMVYYPALARRLMDRLLAEYAKTDKDDKQFQKANKAVGKYLSASIKYVTVIDDQAAFDALLGLRREFYTIEGNRASIVAAMLGGGFVYLPEEMLKLDYYGGKMKEKEFLDTFDAYIAVVPDTFRKNDEQFQASMDAMNEKIAAAGQAGDEKEVRSLKGMRGMIEAVGLMDNLYLSTSLVEQIEKYDLFYTGPRDAAYTAKVAGWYVWLNGISPSAKTADYVAGKLMDMGCEGDAVTVLQLGLEKGRKGNDVQPEHIKACEEKLARLQK